MRCYGEYILSFVSRGIILKKMLLNNYVFLGILEYKNCNSSYSYWESYVFEILFCKMELEITIKLLLKNKKED